METQKFTYTRLHIPSGNIYIGEFSPNHHPCFAEPEAYPEAFIQKKMSELLAHWNRQQRNTWKYSR